MKTYEGKMSSKGQTTIPKKIRDTLNLYEEREIIFIERGDEIILKAKNDSIKPLIGILKSDKPPIQKQELREKVAKERAKRYATK